MLPRLWLLVGSKGPTKGQTMSLIELSWTAKNTIYYSNSVFASMQPQSTRKPTSTIQTINLQTNQPINKPTNKLIDLTTTNLPTNRKQPTDQPTSKETNQSIEQPTDQTTIQALNQQTKHWANQPPTPALWSCRHNRAPRCSPSRSPTCPVPTKRWS